MQVFSAKATELYFSQILMTNTVCILWTWTAVTLPRSAMIPSCTLMRILTMSIMSETMNTTVRILTFFPLITIVYAVSNATGSSLSSWIPTHASMLHLLEIIFIISITTRNMQQHFTKSVLMARTVRWSMILSCLHAAL